MSEHILPEDLRTDLVYALTCTGQMETCFAARNSGLYRSSDGGATWTYLYDALNLEGPLPTTSIIVAPGQEGANPQHLFAGVPGGVLRSLDGGETWMVATLGTPPPAVSALAISPAFVEDGVILAATTEDGIFRSANRGSFWARWNFGLLDLNVYALAISPGFAEDETLFAGVETGIFRSTNGGRAWREVALPVGYVPVISLALSPYYLEDGIIFAGTETEGLLYSDDAGATWTRLGEDEIREPVNAILVSPAFSEEPDLLVLMEDALLLSRDGGVSWHPIIDEASSMTACVAPSGLAPGAPVLVGVAGGDVVRLDLEI